MAKAVGGDSNYIGIYKIVDLMGQPINKCKNILAKAVTQSDPHALALCEINSLLIQGAHAPTIQAINVLSGWLPNTKEG
jgi:hypothetical protein